jgi:hypothetical protein
LVDYLMNNEPEVKYSIEEILEDLEWLKNDLEQVKVF